MSTAATHRPNVVPPAETRPLRGQQSVPLGVAEPLLAAYHAGTEALPAFARVMDMMGGRKVLKSAPTSRAEVHELIQSGLPTRSVSALVGGATLLSTQQMLDAVGISLRTFQRLKLERDGSLSREQSDRAWRLSELLVKASELFGSKQEAERWFDTPALALDRKKPIELMSSSVGARMVEQLLGRIEHGVYT
jgi:putative toxin-antitoxin system antitoxin component (TIGR02293 family)